MDVPELRGELRGEPSGEPNGGPSRPGPLVEPVESLDEETRARAARQLILPGFGELAQRRLRASRVLVIGAGGLGSASVPYLVGSGVGTVGIIDDDVVELSNLHRQVAHSTANLGRRKVASLAERARAIDPTVRVIEHDLRLSASNALELFADYDLVIDGSDNFPTRYLTNDAAELSGIPLVWGAILAHHGQLGVAWHAHGPGYRDLFPQPPDPAEVVSCASGGVLPGLCGTIGSLLATEALKLITGIGEPLIGRVLVYDAMQASTRELRYQRDPLAAPITELVDYELLCAGPSAPPAIDAERLSRLLEQGAALRLVDVRGADERALRRIEASDPLPLPQLESNGAGCFAASPDRTESEELLVIYCAKGPRSIRAARILRESGFEAHYLLGGIEAFARVAPQLVVGEAAGTTAHEEGTR